MHARHILHIVIPYFSINMTTTIYIIEIKMYTKFVFDKSNLELFQNITNLLETKTKGYRLKWYNTHKSNSATTFKIKSLIPDIALYAISLLPNISPIAINEELSALVDHIDGIILSIGEHDPKVEVDLRTFDLDNAVQAVNVVQLPVCMSVIDDTSPTGRRTLYDDITPELCLDYNLFSPQSVAATYIDPVFINIDYTMPSDQITAALEPQFFYSNDPPNTHPINYNKIINKCVRTYPNFPYNSRFSWEEMLMYHIWDATCNFTLDKQVPIMIIEVEWNLLTATEKVEVSRAFNTLFVYLERIRKCIFAGSVGHTDLTELVHANQNIVGQQTRQLFVANLSDTSVRTYDQTLNEDVCILYPTIIDFYKGQVKTKSNDIHPIPGMVNILLSFDGETTMEAFTKLKLVPNDVCVTDIYVYTITSRQSKITMSDDRYLYME